MRDARRLYILARVMWRKSLVNYCLQLRLVNKYSFHGVIGSLQVVQLDIEVSRYGNF